MRSSRGDRHLLGTMMMKTAGAAAVVEDVDLDMVVAGTENVVGDGKMVINGLGVSFIVEFFPVFIFGFCELA